MNCNIINAAAPLLSAELLSIKKNGLDIYAFFLVLSNTFVAVAMIPDISDRSDGKINVLLSFAIFPNSPRYCSAILRFTALGHAIFDYNLNVQIVVFLVTSILGLVLLRKVLKKRFFDRKKDEIKDQLEEFIGHPALVLADFDKGNGQVEFKGTNWKAEGDKTLKKGDHVVIEKKDNLTLYVTPKK